jgi:glutamyl/glutaminyl-tRNA synthetase
MDYDEGMYSPHQQPLTHPGVGVGGNHGPYTQSERLDIYRHYTSELIDVSEMRANKMVC